MISSSVKYFPALTGTYYVDTYSRADFPWNLFVNPCSFNPGSIIQQQHFSIFSLIKWVPLYFMKMCFDFVLLLLLLWVFGNGCVGRKPSRGVEIVVYIMVIWWVFGVGLVGA